VTEQPSAPGESGAVRSAEIPQATVARLATYLRVLSILAEDGIQIVSSDELALAAGVGSAKLRKDLSYLGPNGVRGVGYDVVRLRERIELALGLDQGHRVVLVGVGSLGRALAAYPGFASRGFSIVGLFDSDPAVIGSAIGSLTVEDFATFGIRSLELDPTIGVIAAPEHAAQAICDMLVAAGVRCILSFAPQFLTAPEHVEVRRVDLAVEMQMLSFTGARNSDVPALAGAVPL
jgi:redox-sensing transcriptional repressor